jgi:hypothetical protein
MRVTFSLLLLIAGATALAQDPGAAAGISRAFPRCTGSLTKRCGQCESAKIVPHLAIPTILR